jgi:CheY-like chemotaxis protein
MSTKVNSHQVDPWHTSFRWLIWYLTIESTAVQDKLTADSGQFREKTRSSRDHSLIRSPQTFALSGCWTSEGFTMTKPSSPSILIADDDPQFLRIMEHHIRSWSYRVDCVTDKGQMLRHLAHQRPDLMLMDIRFGEHDGIEVLRQVLADHDGLRVAMLTAFGSIDNAIAAIKIGAIDYLDRSSAKGSRPANSAP